MASDKNPALEYLEEKTAGGFTDFSAGVARGVRGGLGAGGRAGVSNGAYNVGKRLGETGLNTAVAAGGAAAVAGTAALANKLYDAATKTRDFKAMLEWDANLADRHANDPHDARHINMAFSTVRRINPEASRDPLLASAFVNHMLSTSPQTMTGAAEMLSKLRPEGGPTMDVYQTALRGAGPRGTPR